MLVGRWCLGEVGVVRQTVVFAEAMATARIVRARPMKASLYRAVCCTAQLRSFVTAACGGSSGRISPMHYPQIFGSPEQWSVGMPSGWRCGGDVPTPG